MEICKPLIIRTLRVNGSGILTTCFQRIYFSVPLDLSVFFLYTQVNLLAIGFYRKFNRKIIIIFFWTKNLKNICVFLL